MPPANRGRNADSLNDLTNEPLVDKSQFDDSDYSVDRAGRSSPIGQSPIFFRTMVAANKAGKAALKQLLGKLNN
jgi:hypothetical protein